MSLTRVLTPDRPAFRYGVIQEVLSDGTFRVLVDGSILRMSAVSGIHPFPGAQVVTGAVSGTDTIISVGSARGTITREVVILG
jgi:membrane protein implicated in regulation of membrane protease activity